MKQNVNTEKNTNEVKKLKQSYSYYSRVLEKPFDSIEELTAAEDAHFANIKAKEAAAAQKKNDAKKVEDAFKALNAARKDYKEKLTQLTTEYAEALDRLKKAFELGTKDIQRVLTTAEDAYKAALKEFTDAHPEGYHVTLRDGDFETTISGSSTVSKKPTVPKTSDIFDIFDWMFRI